VLVSHQKTEDPLLLIEKELVVIRIVVVKAQLVQARLGAKIKE